MTAKKRFSYTESMEEIETILNQMDEGELDIDDLSEKVKRVSKLITLCREKLMKTEEEVSSVLQDLED